MTLGEKLKVLRKSKNMTQEQLAEQINVSRQAVSKWELDSTSPDLENIIQISNIFNVTTDYILKNEYENVENKIIHNEKKTPETKILLIISTILLITGLFASLSGWHEDQTSTSILLGIIIQVLGIILYFISSILSKKSRLLFKITFVNIAILIVIPLLIIMNIYESLYHGGIIHIGFIALDIYHLKNFAIIYLSIFIVLIIIYFVLRKKFNLIWCNIVE